DRRRIVLHRLERLRARLVQRRGLHRGGRLVLRRRRWLWAGGGGGAAGSTGDGRGFFQAIAEIDDRIGRRLRGAAFEDHPRRGVAAVHRLVGGIVDGQRSAIERDAGKQAARARPRPDL